MFDCVVMPEPVPVPEVEPGVVAEPVDGVVMGAGVVDGVVVEEGIVDGVAPGGEVEPGLPPEAAP